MPSAGAARMPISGVVKVRYNDLDKYGAKSEGIRIEGRHSGLVIAPMAGIVRFAGPFKNYDNMVIIEHENGYHSLVAGLEKVDTLVGQKISAGEPIGKLQSTTNSGKPTLYYELRYKGSAVDPAKKLTDLG
jgi:septal ring factor EnvC (AmiA/AmiB activator)